jgi:hypothetical protein
MIRHAWMIAFVLLFAACSGTGNTPNPGGGMDHDEAEEFAYSRTGDVRVFYYIKPSSAIVGAHSGGVREQSRQLHILVNRSHSDYLGQPESRLRPEERFMHNADMHDLLVVLRDKVGFFDRGNAVNIRDQDPVSRADNDPQISRMIAVEQVRGGQVNTSYFAIGVNENDIQRYRSFERAQAWMLEAVRVALPRGHAGHGVGQHDAIGRD